MPSENPSRAIDAAAESAEKQAAEVNAEERLSRIEAQLASLEPIFEQAQQNFSLGTKLTEYVEDLRSEQVFFNRARYGVAALVIVTASLMITILFLAVFHLQSPLLTATPVAIATFVVGLVSGIVFLLSSFVKGVFRSTTERHADGFLPPALEKSLEILGKVTGKGE